MNFLYQVLLSTHPRILLYVTRERRKMKVFVIATSEFLADMWRKLDLGIFMYGAWSSTVLQFFFKLSLPMLAVLKRVN